MAEKRPVFHKEFGEFLVKLRESKGWKQQQAWDIAARRGLHAVTYQKLRWIEDGTLRNPRPELLRGLSTLYSLSYADLVSRYVASEYGLQVEESDLARHEDAADSGLHSGGSDASSRQIEELTRDLDQSRKDLEQYRIFAEKAINAARVVGRAFAALEKETTAPARGESDSAHRTERSSHRSRRRAG